jgi:hypothetical protein
MNSDRKFIRWNGLHAPWLSAHGGTHNGGTIMKRLFISAAAATIAIGAAYAQAAEFYVVQDSATKKCTIVDKKPTATTSVVVGDGKVFKTRTEAETGMKTIKVCEH